jgi:hypothetical protein
MQPASASLIAKTWPLTLTAPVRVEPVLFGKSVRLTAPAPVPEAPLLTLIQLLSDGTAVQAQPLGAVTEKDAPLATPAVE